MDQLSRLPDEVIRQFLFYPDPEDTLRGLALTCRRLAHIAHEPLLWRYYCIISFRYWSHQHAFPHRLAMPATVTAWKELWLARRRRNARAGRLLDGIINCPNDRLVKFAEIGLLGYDAKDFLLSQCQSRSSAEDTLARKYFATRVLDSFHRSQAVAEWSRFQEPVNPLFGVSGLDRALGAFDLFVLHDQPGDLDETSRTLDDLANQFRADNPDCHHLSTRGRALALVRWVRSRNLVGMDDPVKNYRNMQNCFIGRAIRDSAGGHQSLPIISCAIYCCIAERLGMSAACCAIPTHVHAVVFAPPDQDLDGNPANRAAGHTQRMFLDPFGRSHEIFAEDLRQGLMALGWEHGADVFLRASPTSVIVQRTAQNLLVAHGRAVSLITQATSDSDMSSLSGGTLDGGDPILDQQAANYASLWAKLLTVPTDSIHWQDHLHKLLFTFTKYFSEDAWILQRHLVPLYERHIAQQREQGNLGAVIAGAGPLFWGNAYESISVVKNLDARQPVLQRRYTQATRDRVRFRIGQVVRHRRRGRIAVIVGWAADGVDSMPLWHFSSPFERTESLESGSEGGDDDARPSSAGAAVAAHPPARSPWATNNQGGSIGRRSGADLGNLHGNGRGTSGPSFKKGIFYTCLTLSSDRHVVAQDSLELVTDPDQVSERLFFPAGKFFRRFDRETCTFVSNIRDFYPDD